MLESSDVFSSEVYKIKTFKSYAFQHSSTSINKLVEEIDELNSVKKDLTYSNRLLYEIYNSNKIEGNTLSFQDVESILVNKIIPNDVSYFNLVECLNLRNAVEEFVDFGLLSVDLILDIHKEITKGILPKEECGVLRNIPIFITGSIYTPPLSKFVYRQLKDAVIEFNGSNREILDVFAFKYKLISIHPFTDGNGRTSRLLMNLMLQSLGYPRLNIKALDKRFYYKAIEDSQNRYMDYPWIKYCLIQLKYHLEYLNKIDILE